MALRLAFSDRRACERRREASDRELLDQLQADVEPALDELVQRKTKPLLQVAYRILGDEEEARDVLQLSFVRIWENRHRYDPRWSPNTWMYRIVTNLAIDHLRSRQSRERMQEPLRWQLVGRQSEQTARGLAGLRHQEVDAIFRELAAQLTDKQRAAFVLREMEGLSSAEVASVLECQESTVRNHLFNARKLLQRELLARFPEYAPRAQGAGDPAEDGS